MKKFISILLAALCALLPTLALAQESTTITTTVPSEHAITIVCGEHGKVVIDGKTYSGTFTVSVARLGTLVIKARPNDGYGLSQVQVDDLDGVTVKGQKVMLSGVHCENTIMLTFYKLPEESATSPTVEPIEAHEPDLGEPTLADAVTLPETSATENVLYDEFIGTSGGFEQLSIGFDGEYQPRDYELLNIRPMGADQKNTVLVRTYPDENGNVAQRSLILSATQLVRLAQKQQTRQLIFENGEAAVAVDMVDLLGGDVQKLIGLILAGDEVISEASLNRDWESVRMPMLTAEELETVNVEIRIIPVETLDGSAYDISVWLRWNDQELEISAMLPSLRVCLHVDEEGTAQYAVGYRAENTEDFLPLPSALVLIPEVLPEDQPDAAEKFIVTMMPADGDSPVTVYAPEASLAQERHSAVTASYAGRGCYRPLNVE